MRETSMNQSMTTMTTLHTVIMNDAICSDYNINAQTLQAISQLSGTHCPMTYVIQNVLQTYSDSR